MVNDSEIKGCFETVALIRGAAPQPEVGALAGTEGASEGKASVEVVSTRPLEAGAGAAGTFSTRDGKGSGAPSSSSLLCVISPIMRRQRM